MKKFTFLFTLFITGISFSQNTYVPDDNFEQALIDLGYDTVLDDYVLTANINNVTYLDINSEAIFDLTGIEDFVALTELYCSDNYLTNLDITQNVALTILHCVFNNLTNLNVTQNTVLTELNCSGNNLTSLDVTQNTTLTVLACSFHDELTNLDVTQNTALTVLSCVTNQLNSLDVTQNPALVFLNCSSNNLTSLDVSQNPALTYLRCSQNQLTSIDVAQNTALTELDCRENQLLNLNVKNGNNINLWDFSASYNPNLTCIEVDDPIWSTDNWVDIDPQSYFSEECVLSISDFNLENDIAIYPNPVKNKFKIEGLQNDSQLEIYNLNGLLVQTKKNYTGRDVDVSNLASAIYYVKASDSKGINIKKLVKE